MKQQSYQEPLLDRFLDWLMMNLDIMVPIEHIPCSKDCISVENHTKTCYQCQRRNRQVVKYAILHFDVATFPMQFLSMDLIGEFYSPTSRKHCYALTVICMLTGYVFCIPLNTKTVEEVIQAYIDNIYSRFGGSLKYSVMMGLSLKTKCLNKYPKNLVWSTNYILHHIIQPQMTE